MNIRALILSERKAEDSVISDSGTTLFAASMTESAAVDTTLVSTYVVVSSEYEIEENIRNDTINANSEIAILFKDVFPSCTHINNIIRQNVNFKREVNN
jgi:hypothetical protein